jgi:hypothetical protein
MLRHVALVRTDVSEELSASVIRVTRIGAVNLYPQGRDPNRVWAEGSGQSQSEHDNKKKKLPFCNQQPKYIIGG